MQGEAFTRLALPDYFRVELAWAKLLGLVLLLAPVPARFKEWAYAGFAITLGLRSSPTSRRRTPGGVWLGGGHGHAVRTLVLLWRRLEGAGERRTART
jgi:hypothetical protein